MLINPYRFAPAVDPNFSSVSLLLHGDGANGSTTIIDSSPSPKTVTAFGTAQISTAQSQFGGASILFQDGNNYLQLSNTESAYQMGFGDMTIECWIRTTSYATAAGETYWPIFIRGGIYNTEQIQAYDFRYSPQSGNRLIFVHRPSFSGFVEGTHLFTKQSAVLNLSHNTWYHVCAVRSGNNVTIFLNGNNVTDTTTGNYSWGSFNFSIPVSACEIGRIRGSNGGVIWGARGNIDEFRLTKGVARYTANFTPPTAPFPDS